MKKPLVSVILPTYNGKAEWLSESINSVLNQTFRNFELIIINDASTNNIEETILKYADQDPRIVYLKNKKNLKLTKTLNRGLDVSRGTYVARIDDDDYWMDERKLEKQVSFMEVNKGVSVCGTNVVLGNIDTGEEIKVYMVENDEDIRGRMLLSTQFSHSSILIRRSSLENVGGYYNPDFNLMEDHELWLRMGLEGKLYNLQDFTVFYRINPKGVSLMNRKKQHKLALQLCIKYRKFYPGFLKGLIGNLVLLIFPQCLVDVINRLNRIGGKPII